jgi:hypothetical protein
MKAKITEISVKFDIWDTYYTIKDYGDYIVVTLPMRKYENENNWGLSFYKETVKDLDIMKMVRKCAENQQGCLFAKEGMAHFGLIEIILGIPFTYGWKVDDFE